MMDYGSTALRVVGVQFIIMFRVEKCWKKLIISLDETEHNLSNIVTSSHVEQRKDYYRTLSFSGIFYILTTVLISYNLLKIAKNSKILLFTGGILTSGNSMR